METVNVVINETSITLSQKEANQLPKSVLQSPPISNKVEEDPSPPPIPNADQSSNSSHVDITQEPTSPPPPFGLIEREPSSRVRLNHPQEAIVGNMKKRNLRKCTVDKYVANFVSYSCYLSQVKPIKVEEAL